MKHQMKPKYIIGIDEVGRGPLAGPVTVAALAMPKELKIKNNELRLRDSKKLNVKQRKIWFDYIKKKLFYVIASVSPSIIDKINISQAANLAATRALKKLIMKRELPPGRTKVFCDGGLYPKIQDTRPTSLRRSRCGRARYKIQTVVRGDEKIPAIALASIVAKVTRDKKMARLHKKYPRYGFDKHKGYGTKKHIKALKKHGPSDIHRQTFLKKFH